MVQLNYPPAFRAKTCAERENASDAVAALTATHRIELGQSTDCARSVCKVPSGRVTHVTRNRDR